MESEVKKDETSYFGDAGFFAVNRRRRIWLCDTR
jgi:hypothetical protein